ncbi:MAG: right-handed parallel beta-helix repeat-containing protein, partial [Euryarchaeota archaeon]|nr:right-handed parallel beta-helix repeat-containing protein [Euryarchaeota archaeon]
MNKLNGIILVLALWTAFCGTATASQLHVNESGWWHDGDMFNASSTPIQSAVDGATDDDSIFVRSGSYSESVEIDKDLMLEGKDRGATIIDGGGRSGDCIRVSGAYVGISGFTIKNAGGYGVYAYVSGLNLSNVTIRDCGDDAIHFKRGKMLTLRDSILENCDGGLIYNGDYKSSSTGNATIERNIIRNNTGSGLFIYLAGSTGKRDEVIITDNVVTNNTGYGVKCNYHNSPIDSITMRNNTVRNCTNDGVYIKGATDLSITDLTIENAGNNGLWVNYCGKMVVNPPFSIKEVSGYGIYASGPDFTLDNATIRGCGDDAIHFKSGKMLTLRDSVLENSGGGLIYDDDYKSSATGNATIERNIIRNNTGDGLYIKLASGKSVVINDNIIINSTGSGSDGIYCDISSGGLVTIANNIVKNSGKDGMYLSGAKNSTLLNNTVISNNGRGISLYSSHSFLIFHNNLINNSPNAYDSDPASNDWYHPFLLEGNYWSDYTGDDDGSGTEKHDMAGDGIGDTDIPHPGEEYDQYPFVNARGWLIQHDIAVTNIDAPVFVEVNLTIMINSTVWNFGLSNESNITVDFILDGISQSNATIPFLKSGSYTNVCFQWTAPSVAGMHDILIYAKPVVDETVEWNNKLNKIITVGDIWVPATYPTIQQAVDNANAGDTIIVRDGTYTENVGVNKSLTILSENGSTLTIVQAANPDDSTFEVIADYVNISGFTVTGTDKAGFYLYGADCCNISSNNVSNNGKGIYLNFSSNCVLINNNASSNNDIGSKDAAGYGYGIHLSFSSNCTLINNAANANTGQGSRGNVAGDKPGGDGCGNGIMLHSSSSCTLINNTANANIGSGGNGGSDHGVTDCGTDGGDGYGYGIVLSSSDDCTLMNNTAHTNMGRGGNGGYSRRMIGGDGGCGGGCGIVLSSSSNCTLISNTANTNLGGGGSSGGGFISGYGGYGYDFGIHLS